MDSKVTLIHLELKEKEAKNPVIIRFLKPSKLCISSQLDIVASLVHRYFHFEKAGVKILPLLFSKPTARE
jgi:hypothetical protein